MYAVNSTNMEVAIEYESINNEQMHAYLLGQNDEKNHSRYISDIMKYPESAWITEVSIPNETEIYGPLSGQLLPVLSYITFPSNEDAAQTKYSFPYHNDAYGSFENMLGPEELPSFADPKHRYPLIILAHGLSAHGIYEVEHAQNLASQGYIVAVIFYGDDRNMVKGSQNHHLDFLRPLLTKSVLDSIIQSRAFGGNIDTNSIGISGHSFGGFTALALAGGKINENPLSVVDPRIKACVIAAPWVGGKVNGRNVFCFGEHNAGLKQVSAPIICLFGSKDESTLSSFILPATKRLSGPRYVIELIDQAHIFEKSSWQDRNNWEALFFSAYLKNDATALDRLRLTPSISHRKQDIQLFDYQKLP